MNLIIFDKDKDNNIYCFFQEHPILRKYSSDGILLFEKDFMNIPEVKTEIENWHKKINENNYDNYQSKYLVRHFDVDDENVYVKFTQRKSPVYVFNKHDFTIVKKLNFLDNNLNTLHVFKFDVSSPEYIYVLATNKTFAKYIK